MPVDTTQSFSLEDAEALPLLDESTFRVLVSSYDPGPVNVANHDWMVSRRHPSTDPALIQEHAALTKKASDWEETGFVIGLFSFLMTAMGGTLAGAVATDRVGANILAVALPLILGGFGGIAAGIRGAVNAKRQSRAFGAEHPDLTVQVPRWVDYHYEVLQKNVAWLQDREGSSEVAAQIEAVRSVADVLLMTVIEETDEDRRLDLTVGNAVLEQMHALNAQVAALVTLYKEREALLMKNPHALTSGRVRAALAVASALDLSGAGSSIEEDNRHLIVNP